MDGEGVAKALKIFAEHFCLPNTFHANGDQTRQGYSNYTYRPFTLEGNFAFAAGIHEMLIQSHTGVIRLFPAIPESWKDVSFDRLRTVGAFLVSAQRKDGKISSITVESEKGGILRLAKPGDGNSRETGGKTLDDKNGVWTIKMNTGETICIDLL
jgi:alpha-L-fucosidase 2